MSYIPEWAIYGTLHLVGGDVESVVPFIGLITGLISIAGALIAVGREKQARVDLEKRFDEARKPEGVSERHGTYTRKA